MSANIPNPTELWIIPRAPRQTNLLKPHCLEAYRSRQAALEGCAHEWKYAAWRDGLAEPVHFAQIRGNAPADMNAPKESWFLMDLDNGNPEEPNGRIWVFPFDTRALARKYSDYLAEMRKQPQSAVICVSAPFQLFQ